LLAFAGLGDSVEPSQVLYVRPAGGTSPADSAGERTSLLKLSIRKSKSWMLAERRNVCSLDRGQVDPIDFLLKLMGSQFGFGERWVWADVLLMGLPGSRPTFFG